MKPNNSSCKQRKWIIFILHVIPNTVADMHTTSPRPFSRLKDISSRNEKRCFLGLNSTRDYGRFRRTAEFRSYKTSHKYQARWSINRGLFKCRNFERYHHSSWRRRFRGLYSMSQLVLPGDIYSVQEQSLMKISYVTSQVKNIWTWHIFLKWNFLFTYEMRTFSHMKTPNSHVKWTDSKFHVWNLGQRNMYFAYEMEDLLMKIHFTYDIFISHMELKQFTYEILFFIYKMTCAISVRAIQVHGCSCGCRWSMGF